MDSAGSTVLTVTARVLQSIAVSPSNPSVPKGETDAFTATGRLSDNSTEDLTSRVTWASADTSVATITAAGVVIDVAPGTSSIGATLDGISGSTPVTVAPTPLVGVDLVQFTRNKKHQVTQITIVFGGAVNPGEANSLATYRLAMPGKKGSFAAKNAQVIHLKSAVYDGALDHVTLTPRKPFALKKPVQILIRGKPPAGLQDSSGRYIDGGQDAVFVPRRTGVTVSSAAEIPSGSRPLPQASAVDIVLAQEPGLIARQSARTRHRGGPGAR